MNIGKAFLHPAGWGSVFPAKSCWDAWRSGSQLARGQVNIVGHDLPNERQQMKTADRQNFIPQFIQLVKPWLYDMWSGIVMEKNWTHSVDQCQLQLLQFSVYLIDVLRVLLRCNGFSKIQKVVVDHNSSRPPTVTLTFFFFWMQFWLWEVLWSFFLVQPLSWSLPVVLYNPLFITCHNPIEKWFIIVAENKRRQHFKMMGFFLLVVRSWGTHLSNFSPFQFASKAKWP